MSISVRLAHQVNFTGAWFEKKTIKYEGQISLPRRGMEHKDLQASISV
jgi:hypothetical protein